MPPKQTFMNIDVAKHIESILYDNSAVIIPGFGGLMSAYRSASIDHVQGILYPPSLSISFNENLHVNDGILMNHLLQQEGLDSEQARIAIEQFVENAKIRLEKREIVIFPGVGRLYKDYEGRMQFLQDNTNFNQDAYGLPNVQFYPILRNRALAGQEAPQPAQAGRPTAASKKENRFVPLLRSAQTVLPLLAGFAMIGFAVSYMLMTDTGEVNIAENLTMPVAEKRVNKKPTVEDITTMSVIDGFSNKSSESRGVITEEITEDGELIDEIPEVEIPEVEKEEIEIGPSRKRGVIVIGCYKFKKSIQKMADKVVAEGFDVYQARIGNSDIIRVGAQFAYEDRKDLYEKLEIIKDKIEDRAWILVE